MVDEDGGRWTEMVNLRVEYKYFWNNECFNFVFMPQKANNETNPSYFHGMKK